MRLQAVGCREGERQTETERDRQTDRDRERDREDNSDGAALCFCHTAPCLDPPAPQRRDPFEMQGSL